MYSVYRVAVEIQPIITIRERMDAKERREQERNE